MFPESSVRQEMRLIAHRYRQDAYQSAWVAYLAGRSAKAAVINYARRERIHEARERQQEHE